LLRLEKSDISCLNGNNYLTPFIMNNVNPSGMFDKYPD